ncbi:MerR family transcriptional regulator [Pontivivens nitratireducens]|uniref:MerR family DNA-binding transcriptional regulator n=1 Tax=Pontivivens nitratireducens TaxID=2758038 RepID=A0A6G7VM58_9RHOB|nr:MerR family DNA-binding transcriptional regulator [Pontibrevibacter nitratireducens]QIK40956.1 MerR family DNA-binding transcriptional regulator [Pontibrevibacter nitratireducens]
MTEVKQTLQQMCEEFDITPRTLRYYEYIELLSPQRDGRKRLYGGRERARLTLILRGRRFGFSLEEIRQWLALYEIEDNQTTQYREWVEISTRQIDELESRKRELEEAIDELTRLRDVVESALDT